jgi:signal transduction histidine kinase
MTCVHRRWTISACSAPSARAPPAMRPERCASASTPRAVCPSYPAAVETAVYRIAQEAMTNVVRHAQARSCTIRLYCADGEVVVEVRDDGRGLARNHPSGVGLQAMKERATELDGQLVLESLPGGGTLVQARLPLEVDDG